MSQHRKLPWKNQQSQHHCCRYTGIQSRVFIYLMSKDFSVFNLKCLQDQRDTEFVEELMNVLGDEVKEIENFNVYKKLCNTDVPKQVKEIESFVIVYKYKDRFTSPFARTLRVITKMFGENF